LRDLRVLLFKILRESSQQVEVLTDCPLHAVVQHLHDDLGAVVQRRPMDLCNRTGTTRDGLECREQLFDRGSQLAGHDPARNLGRVRRNRHLEQLELRSNFGTDDVGTQAEHLAELDECRSELGGGGAHPGARSHLGERGICEPLRQLHAPHSVAAVGPIGEAVPTEHRDDLIEPLAMLRQRCGQLIHGASA